MRYALYDEMTTGPEVDMTFLGADSDLEHVVADAERLVLGRRYSHLQIQDGSGQAVVRVYRPDVEAGVWTARLFDDVVEHVLHPSEPVLFDQDAPEQLVLPGLEGVR